MTGEQNNGNRKRRGVKLDDLPPYYRAQAAAQLDAMATRGDAGEPKPDEGQALVNQVGNALLLVDLDCPVTVRIVRVGGRTMDDDNLASGCKELRDAIAAALGRLGDSEADGMRWEYDQTQGDEQGTMIEVYS